MYLQGWSGASHVGSEEYLWIELVEHAKGPPPRRMASPFPIEH
jgi:hypothetical protein